MAPSTQLCALCSDNFIVNSKCIKCDYCAKWYHLTCIRIKDQFLKFKQDFNNVKWFCDECVQEVDSKLKKTVEDIDKKTREVLEKTELLINLIQQQQQPKYADVVKKTNNNIEPLIIKPKVTNQNSTVTKSVLEQKINPADIAASVSKIKGVSHGCVVVHCKDKQSRDNLKLKTQSELGEDYEVVMGKMLNPKIKIINVKEDQLVNPEEFITTVANQNFPDNMKNGIKFVRKSKSSNNKTKKCNVILELSTGQYNYLVHKGNHLYVEWNSYKFFDFVSVLRCFKCWRFGHFADKCSGSETCPMCNKNHKKEECNSNAYECTNCKYAIEVLKIPNITCDHHVFDIKCHSLQRQIETVKNKIQYNI